MTDDYEQRLIKWAHKYDGYARLARGPENLWEVVKPLHDAFEIEGAIPDWAGVDLLRGWAFYLVRAHRHGGGWEPIRDQFPEFAAIINALREHPDARKSDRPPSSSEA